MPYNQNPYFLGNYSNPYMSMFNQQYPAQTPTPQGGFIYVSGREEAQSYPLAPNTTIALWQNDGKAVYIKQADASGKQEIRAFDLVEQKQVEKQTSVEPVETEATSQYVKQEDFDRFSTKFEMMLSDIKDELAIIKDDVYGIARKK